MKRSRLWLCSLLAAPCLLLAACSTPPAEDNTARWLAHPEFPAAAKAAPHLLSDILTTTTRLEAEAARAPRR